MPIVESTDVDAHCAGVDPDHARHGNSPWSLILTYRASDFGDRLGIEHEIVFFEQAGDARLVDLHLQMTDTQGPEHRHTLTLHAIVGDLNAFHAERRDGVDVGHAAQSGASGPGVARDQTDAGRTGVEEQLGSLAGADYGGRLRAVGQRRRAHGAAETLPDPLDNLRALLGPAGGDGDVGASLRKKAGRSHADRTRTGRHHSATSLKTAAGGLLQLRDRGGRRRVRSVRVEHHRHAQRAEERLPHGRQQLLTHGHVGPADEDRRVAEILGAAREHRAVHEIADRSSVTPP